MPPPKGAAPPLAGSAGPVVTPLELFKTFCLNCSLTSPFQRTMHTFDDVVWHVSWSVMGDILAVSGGDNKVKLKTIT